MKWDIKIISLFLFTKSFYLCYNTPDGACMDWYYGTCFDYDYDFAVEKWLHNNNEDNGFLISQLYAQCVLKNI